jgi:16S rRNA (uracil1498-N3)-methyltransferase
MPPDLWLLFCADQEGAHGFHRGKGGGDGGAADRAGADGGIPIPNASGRIACRPMRWRRQSNAAAPSCPRWQIWLALDRLLAGWPAGRRILWCDESLVGVSEGLLARGCPGPWAILIGPEGGFSDQEKASLRAMPQVLAVSLGPRILRADTAAVAALTLWQAALGDWR